MNRRYRMWARFGRPLKDLEFRFNHPMYYAMVRDSWRKPYPQHPTETRSERLCAVLDAISGNWFHD